MRRLIRRPRTLRHALVSLLLGVLLPLLLLSTVLLWRQWELQREARISWLSDAALALQLAVDRELALHQTALQVLATSVAIDKQDWAALHAAAGEAATVRPESWVIMGDAFGRTLINTAVEYGDSLPEFLPVPPETHVDWQGRRLPFFDAGVLAEPLSSGKARIGNLFYGPVIHGPAVGVSIPVQRHGEVAYALAFLYPPKAFVRFLQRQPQAKHLLLGIIDGNGLYIARSREPDAATASTAPAPFDRPLGLPGEGIIEAATLDGIPSFFAHRRSELASWTVVVAVPRETVLGPLRRSLILWLLAILTVAGIAAVLAYRFWCRVALPLGELAAQSRDITAREVEKPQADIVEVGTLRAALRNAAAAERSREEEARLRFVAEERARREAQESGARMRALVDASPLGIAITDLDGHPVFYNPTCERMHGMSLEEAVGKGWAAAVHPDDRERIARSWYEAAAAGRAWSETYRFLHGDGQIVWVSCRAAPITVGAERIGYVGTFADITALKQAELERERLLQSEQQARVAAENAANMRDQMMAVVAHDLRHPLQVIAMAVASMEHAAPKEEQRVRQLAIIRRTTRSMSGLIEDLLDVSRIESGHFPIERSPVQITALLRELSELFEALAQERGVALSFDAPADLPAVSGDRRRLVQVLSNLVGNSLKFTPPQGHVSVRARALRDSVQLSVEDDGPGVSAEDLEHLFDRFWRGRGATGPGAGLGLFIAKSIVAAHRGRIWAESEPGQGTAIHFVVPIDRCGAAVPNDEAPANAVEGA